MRVLCILLCLFAASCLRGGVETCESDDECFGGEQCIEGRCTPGSDSNSTTNGETCDLDACVSEWTQDVACRAEQCIVLSCVDGADRCSDGCCPVTSPPDGPVDIGSADLRLMDVEIDPRGFPEIAWLDADTLDIRLTRWTGRGWETDLIAANPEPSLAFDLEYDGDVRTLTYLESFGSLHHARQDLDGVWTSTRVMDAPEPTDVADPRFFFRMHFAGHGNSRLVCALFGNVTAGDSTGPDGELPDLYVAEWAIDHWESELLVSENPVRRVCSVAYDDFGQPHVAFSEVADLSYVRHATRAIGGDAWEIDEDPNRIGILTSNESLQLRDGEVHIFAGAGVRNDNDELVSGLYDYIRQTNGVWTEQAIYVSDDPQEVLGIFDAGASGSRLEVLVLSVDPGSNRALVGRLFSTQSRTWGTLQLFDEVGNIGDGRAAVGPDRFHVFTQPSGDTRQLNYFSQEAP